MHHIYNSLFDRLFYFKNGFPINTTILKYSLPIVLLFCASSTFANDSWYVAANGLNADYEVGTDENGYSVAVGKYLNSNVSLELGFADFGGDADSVSGVDAEFDATAIQFSAVGYLPLSEKAGLFARAGVERVRTDATVNSVRSNLDDTNPFYGAGGYVNLTDQIDVLIEYQRHEILETDLDTVSAGITIKTY